MISAPFSLLQLPKTFSKSQDPLKINIQGTHAYLGISSSSVSTFSLQPPQELDAFSVSPGTTITALCVSNSNKIFFATKERKKHFLKVANGPSIPVSGEVKCIYGSDDSIIVLFANMSVQSFNHQLEHTWTAKDFGGKKESICYSELIDATTFFIITVKNSTYNLIVLSFSSTSCAQLSRTVLSQNVNESDIWSFSDGTLFLKALDNIVLYDALTGNELTKIDMHVSDLLALSKSTCLVTQEGKLIVIDTNFESKLSSYQPELPVKLIKFVSEASYILAVDSDDHLVGFPYVSSEGSLFNSIGHGIQTDVKFDYSYTDIFDFNDHQKDVKKTAIKRIEAAVENSKHILSELEGFSVSKNGTEFSKIVQYLKGTPWEECKPQEIAVTYEESDRHVDGDLIKFIASLAFGPKPLKFAAYLPETVGIYLLTHPLFPTNEPEFRSIFSALESNPLLYRQAVVTLRSTSALNLIEALSSPSDEIFDDAVCRLNDEYSNEQITSGLKDAFSRSGQITVSNLSKLVTRLSQHPSGWPLITPMVDIIGLHSWDTNLVKALDTRLNRQVDYIKGLKSVNLVISELLRTVDVDVQAASTLSNSDIKKKSKKGKKGAKRDTKDIPRYSIETLVFSES